MIIILYVFIGLAWALAYYLLEKDKGEREPTSALWAAFGFGVLSLIPTGIFEFLLVPTEALDDTVTASTGVTLYSAAMIGVIEEVCKFLPLAFFIYKKRYFNEHTDGIIYFALAGLGFGLPENIMYTLQYGGEAFARIFMTPFFHSATTALVGYALVRAKLHKTSLWYVVVAMLAAIAIHGMYDFGLMSGIPMLVLGSLGLTGAMSVYIFVIGVHAKKVDQKHGLSVVGINAFCRSCGYPNPKRYLYCSHCGKHA
ncbi:PrsW family intramembrane metalloprotease [Candidatus Saccharibacteria bacterium]|nr:PrsW family intramembrane metalloprotease [Candidatus Saccharibacteria bacterium]HPR09623.1 PrsW family glutamic-type intramembrane protease [Candidatus Saccharibacteria bacterium]